MKETVSRERPGQRFHNFVAILERMFAHQDGVAIASSLRVPDKDTGRLREHDVVIIRRTHHGPNLTAIECRDQRRKVGVPQIEAFAKKCEKTGIHHGIVVAANGFTSTARTKARALNLTCMELADADSFEWIGTVTIIGQFYNFTAVEGRVRVVEDGRKVTNPSTVYTPDGLPYTGEGIQSLIIDKLPSEVRKPTTRQTINSQIVIPMEGFFVIDNLSQRFQVKDITFTYALEIEVTERRITLHHYLGENAALEIASGQITFSGGQSTVAFVKSKDGVAGYVVSTGGLNHGVKIGDLPERRLG
ncbi:restriction endonuclease [Bradyrhizobium diazoefficiens]|uniref:restriction endonuclease n=1 Tax=Bradyrhizobium diazoefficiens TaxID=1355477 RepID=UPI00190DAB90|nr:restriction endonuclease [Bradyrhizobium diazoefficiens]QQO33183.1 restriction endonuclease [Bradyrhizobium diazoefficiens]